MKTTLNELQKYSRCEYEIELLLEKLGKTKADDEPLEFPATTLIEVTGINDAFYLIRAIKGHEKILRLFAVWCARKVQYCMNDHRSINALDVAERYANGNATDSDLYKALYAAWDATKGLKGIDLMAAMAAAWCVNPEPARAASICSIYSASTYSSGFDKEDDRKYLARDDQVKEFHRILTELEN